MISNPDLQVNGVSRSIQEMNAAIDLLLSRCGVARWPSGNAAKGWHKLCRINLNTAQGDSCFIDCVSRKWTKW